MAEPQEGIRQEISEAQVAATSGTGNASIHITNYYYREGPEPAAIPAASPAAELEDDLACPYRSLFHFGPDDAELFFGRDAVVESLHRAIGSRAFLPLLGASGSGKSSVVLAGLVPRLQRDGHWRFTHFRPGADPFHALALALVPLYEPQLNATERMAQARQLASFLRSGAVPLPDVLAQVRQNFAANRVLLIADQFEELYTLTAHDAARRQFLDTLLDGFPGDGNDAKATSSHQARLVLTMRADFLGNALSYRPFADLLQQGDFKLGPMSGAELREVIEKPAAACGVAFESGLVERVLEDVEAEPGVLPLLEFALTELWARREGHTITHGAYTAIGGVDGALARHADDSYAALSEEQKEEARRVFLQLVRPGEGTEDTRRVATRQELGAAPWELVKRLADARLVVTNRGEDAAEETVEVVHEALIRHWGELRGWMASDRVFRTWQERLRASLAQWQATQRDEGLLLRGAALSEAGENLKKRAEDLSAGEREFIEASAAAIDRAGRQERRRRQLIFGGLGGGLALVSLAGLTAWGQLVRAQHQRGEAMAATAQLTAATNPADALLEAIASAGLSRFGAFRVGSMALPTSSATALIQVMRQNPERNRLIGHEGQVLSVVYSPDGHTIASASTDRTVRLWDARNGEPIGKPLKGHNDAVTTVVFSPNGRKLATGSRDGTIRLWDAKSGEPLGKSLKASVDWVRSAAFSPDGRTIASAGDDETVRLWDAESLAAIGTPLKGHRRRVTSVAFSPDGRTIASAGDDKMVRLWDAKSGAVIGTPFRSHEGGVDSVVFSPDGRTIASTADNKTVLLWDSRSGKPIGKPLKGHLDSVFSVAFSPDGAMLASASNDKTVRLWDTMSGEPIGKPFNGHESSVTSVTFSPDARTIASASSDRTVRLWDARGGQVSSKRFKGNDCMVLSTVFSPDGRILATVCNGMKYNRKVILRDAKSGEPIGKPLNGDIISVAFSPDSSTVVSASIDGTVHLWDARSGEMIGKLLKGNNDKVLSVVFSPDGRTIVSASSDGTVHLWDFRSGKPIGKPHKAQYKDVSTVAISPDGRMIASADYNDDEVRLWDVRSGEPIGKPLSGNDDSVSNVLFSPEGRMLAVVSKKTVRLWDAKSGKLIGLPLKGLVTPGVLSPIAFSPDGGMLASASANVVQLWDARKGKKIGEPLNDRSDIVSLAFSRDGHTIASGTLYSTVQLWNSFLPPLQMACEALRYHPSLKNPYTDVGREAMHTCHKYAWR